MRPVSRSGNSSGARTGKAHDTRTRLIFQQRLAGLAKHDACGSGGPSLICRKESSRLKRATRIKPTSAADVVGIPAPLLLDLAIALSVHDCDCSHLAVGVACGANLERRRHEIARIFAIRQNQSSAHVAGFAFTACLLLAGDNDGGCWYGGCVMGAVSAGNGGGLRPEWRIIYGHRRHGWRWVRRQKTQWRAYCGGQHNFAAGDDDAQGECGCNECTEYSAHGVSSLDLGFSGLIKPKK